MTVPHSILLRMGNISDKVCRENQNTHFMFNKIFFPQMSCRYVGNERKYGSTREATDGNIIRCMRVACWITKTTNTHLEYVIFIAFPWQQYLRKHVSVLRCHVHCLPSYFV
jgi:hypothetical protein